MRLAIVAIGVAVGTIAKGLFPPPDTNVPPRPIIQVDSEESATEMRAD